VIYRSATLLSGDQEFGQDNDPYSSASDGRDAVTGLLASAAAAA
jgi:hypothetical protein